MKLSVPSLAVAESRHERPALPGAARTAVAVAAFALSVVGLGSMGLVGCTTGSTVKPRDAGQGGSSATGGAGGAEATGGAGGGDADAGDPATGGAGAGGGGGTGSTVVDAGLAGDGACAVVVQEHVAGPGDHAAFCAPLAFSTNPPASGPHYGSWPAFKVYDKAVPWGYLLHGLEHGAVVISYNCPDGCAEDLAAAKAFVASLPKKTGCETPSVILTPSPKLDVRFAASAWNDPKAYTLRASCFDRDAFAAFYTSYADRNYESSCGGGDWSNNGWCPNGMTPPCGEGCL